MSIIAIVRVCRIEKGEFGIRTLSFADFLFKLYWICRTSDKRSSSVNNSYTRALSTQNILSNKNNLTFDFRRWKNETCGKPYIDCMGSRLIDSVHISITIQLYMTADSRHIDKCLAHGVLQVRILYDCNVACRTSRILSLQLVA